MSATQDNSLLEAKVNDLIDDQILQAFWDGYKHHKTTDLVLFFDDTEDRYPLSVHKRTSLINSPNVPESLLMKLNKPASQAKFGMTASETVFWFIAFFQDGEMACLAINAKRIGDPGTA